MEGPVTPTESWPQDRLLPYIALSAITGVSLTTLVDTSQVPGTVSERLNDTREPAAMVLRGPVTSPACVMQVSWTLAAVPPGFCTRTQVSNPSPVEPSARYQVLEGPVTPTESWPPIVVSSPPAKRISAASRLNAPPSVSITGSATAISTARQTRWLNNRVTITSRVNAN